MQINPMVLWLWIGGADHGARHRGRVAPREAPTPVLDAPTADEPATEPSCRARRGDDVKRRVRWIALAVGRRHRRARCRAGAERASDPNATKVPLHGRTDRRRLHARRPSTARPLTPAELAGKTVVVNFWNTWCVPCIEEAPALARVLRTAQGRARLRDGRHRPRRHRDSGRATTSTEDGIGWTIAFDPEEQGRARVRHDRPAGDVRDRARRPGRRRTVRPKCRLEDLETHAARARHAVSAG